METPYYLLSTHSQGIDRVNEIPHTFLAGVTAPQGSQDVEQLNTGEVRVAWIQTLGLSIEGL